MASEIATICQIIELVAAGAAVSCSIISDFLTLVSFFSYVDIREGANLIFFSFFGKRYFKEDLKDPQRAADRLVQNQEHIKLDQTEPMPQRELGGNV